MRDPDRWRIVVGRFALTVLVASCGFPKPLVAGDADGGGDDDSALPTVHDRLLWAIAATDPTTGAAIEPIYVPIGSESTRNELPTIMVGEPVGGSPLAPAVYDVSDGSFAIPYPLHDAPHRIVYTLPGETVAHEIQWSLSGATLSILRLTRLDAPAIPTNSSYQITPTGLAGSLPAPSIATTGVFSFDNRSGKFTSSNATTTYNFAANAQLLAGPSGEPQGSLKDFVVLAEWSANTASQMSFVGYALAHIDLVASSTAHATPEPTWMTASRTLKTTSCTPDDCIPVIDATSLSGRLNALGALTGTLTRRMTYGISPSSKLPGFVPGSAPQYVDQPALVPFMISTSIDSTITLADPTKPTSQLPFERALSAQVFGARTVSGATLTSSLQVISNVFSGNLGVQAPLALQVKLGAVDLATADNVMIDPSSQAVALSWTDEIAGAADDYVVTLYEIANNQLAPVRIYQVLAPSVSVDGSLLLSGHTYTFAITARHGFSGAKQGDYGADTVTFPFSEATTATATFHVR